MKSWARRKPHREKIALLQQWYCLSDEAVEAAVDDRISFRRFCGLPLDTAAPKAIAGQNAGEARLKSGKARKKQ